MFVLQKGPYENFTDEGKKYTDKDTYERMIFDLSENLVIARDLNMSIFANIFTFSHVTID